MSMPATQEGRKARRIVGVGIVAVASLLTLAPAAEARRFSGPTYSSPITLSANGRYVWSVNPATDTVSVIRTSTNAVVKTVRVGDEPESVALDPNNRYAYVAN